MIKFTLCKYGVGSIWFVICMHCYNAIFCIYIKHIVDYGYVSIVTFTTMIIFFTRSTLPLFIVILIPSKQSWVVMYIFATILRWDLGAVSSVFLLLLKPLLLKHIYPFQAHGVTPRFLCSIGVKCISGVIVIVLTSSEVDRRFEPRSGQTKDYQNSILFLLR